jgi:hypothetical protein
MASRSASPRRLALRAEGCVQRANARAADLSQAIRIPQGAGPTSLRVIAAGLNEQGIPTARGQGSWTAVQVQRVLQPPCKAKVATASKPEAVRAWQPSAKPNERLRM